MSVPRPQKMKNRGFVMPAWIAGIQARKDAPGDIHVHLDSSPPCWNDGIEGRCFKLSETHFTDIFKGRHRRSRRKRKTFTKLFSEPGALRVLRGEIDVWNICF